MDALVLVKKQEGHSSVWESVWDFACKMSKNRQNLPKIAYLFFL